MDTGRRDNNISKGGGGGGARTGGERDHGVMADRDGQRLERRTSIGQENDRGDRRAIENLSSGSGREKLGEYRAME